MYATLLALQYRGSASPYIVPMSVRWVPVGTAARACIEAHCDCSTTHASNAFEAAEDMEGRSRSYGIREAALQFE